jgi:hypothetical protein
MRRRGRRLALALLLLLALLGVGGCLISERRPESAPSPEADALARRVERAIAADAWARTGAVRFTFAGRHAWLWDRERGRVRLRSGDTEVLMHTGDRRGVAFEDGQPLSGEDLEKALASTWSAFCNDTFWLNPLVKLFDDGTRRSLRTLEGGGPGLLVEYGAGGVTPGDAYLWHLGPDDRPIAWQMWVQILPIGGVQMGWSGWQTLATGAVVSTLHTSTLMDLALTDVAGAARLEELEPGAFDRLP